MTLPAHLALFATVLLGIASAANAASISLATDKATYVPGETVTLSVTADGEGESMQAIVAQVSYDGSVLAGPAFAQSQEVVLDLAGGLDTGDVYDPTGGTLSWETILNQANLLLAPESVGVVTATAQFVMDVGAGTTVFTTGLGPNFGDEQFQFGSASPGETSNVITIIPEPATAALLGTGLAAVALGRRGGRRRVRREASR